MRLRVITKQPAQMCHFVLIPVSQGWLVSWSKRAWISYVFILSHVALDVLFYPLKHLILSCFLQSPRPP